MRHCTWFFLSTTLAVGLVVGIFASFGVMPRQDVRAHGTSSAWLALVLLIGGVPSAFGLLFSGVLELFDRLPPAHQRWLRRLGESGVHLPAGSFLSMPVRVHVGLLLLLAAEGLLSEDGAAHVLTLVLVVLIHELGHAMLVRRYNHHVVSIDLGPLGGACQYDGVVTPLEHALIAWGGVAAQAALQLLVFAVLPLLRALDAQRAIAWLATLGAANIAMMIFNLIPIPPLDGASAWKALPLLWSARGKPEGPARQVTPSPRAPHLRVVHDALEQAKRDARARSKRDERNK
jgi:Zn-dependent protease